MKNILHKTGRIIAALAMVYVFAFLVCYIITSILESSMNPSKWTEGAILMIFLLPVLGILAVLFVITIAHFDKEKEL